MNSTRSIVVNERSSPVALQRSSIRVLPVRDSVNSFDQEGSTQKSRLPSGNSHYYSNLGVAKDSTQPTRINISSSNSNQEYQKKNYELTIGARADEEAVRSVSLASDVEYDSYLSSLIDQYQASLKCRECEGGTCNCLKLSSYRMSEILLERISSLKNELHVARKNISNNISRVPIMRKSVTSDTAQELANTETQAQHNLLESLAEKDQRIQELERLVENLRRLRLQDASQFEERAAKIRDWVTNKIQELEDRHKPLREQNKQLKKQDKKQRETIESLRNKLASLSNISKPLKNLPSLDYIDQVRDEQMRTESPKVSERTPTRISRRRQAKKSSDSRSLSSSSEDEKLKLSVCIDPPPNSIHPPQVGHPDSRSSTDVQAASRRQASPVYDCVTIDPTNRTKCDKAAKHDELTPPPPPSHQKDTWESQLYDLADESFSRLVRQSCSQTNLSTGRAQAELDSTSDGDSSTRKSTSSQKNDLISLVKPSYTTIDGNRVVDNLEFELELDDWSACEKDANLPATTTLASSLRHQNSAEHPGQTMKMRKDSVDSHENHDHSLAPNLFDSPLSSRTTGKDSILRTQSVRRNPAPGKLLDFISADLIKRGHLVKPGALKNHNRWFVLKNFHLYSFKSELEETSKAAPNSTLKLEPTCQVISMSSSGDSAFPFKISYPDKTLQLIAETSRLRDEWVRILNVTISMSQLDADTFAKHNSTYEGILSVTRHGHSKRCHATLVNHVLFFLKSLSDPTPLSYVSVKEAKIREITDNQNYDLEQHEALKEKLGAQECSLAIYPKFSMTSDPVYVTLGSQDETNKWLYHLSLASGVDQAYGTPYERTLTQLMIGSSLGIPRDLADLVSSQGADSLSGCLWRDQSVMQYEDRPIAEPLTTLPNETLRMEAIELFKSVLLFTQAPIEPNAIDYHVCLLQNCLSRFLRYPELRNEFYAQLIKQSTYVVHRCSSPKSSSSNQRSSQTSSLSPSASECQFITDMELLDSLPSERTTRVDSIASSSSQSHSARERNDNLANHVEPANPPSQSELSQVMQILAIAVSLNLPRGRMRYWLTDHLRKFASQRTGIGKYALYTLQAIERTLNNGTRENVPSRTEIVSILFRNPYDYSNPHTLPVNFADGSYLVVEADGSTTVEEFMDSMRKQIDIRQSLVSDFYLFADDPSGVKELHILEPQRKVLDIVGWWEQIFRKNNCGRYQNTRVIRLICKKRLPFKAEEGETQQERLLIVHQMNQEVVSQRIPLSDKLAMELAAMMAKLTFGDLEEGKDVQLVESLIERAAANFLPGKSSQSVGEHNNVALVEQLAKRWKQISGRPTRDYTRVYLNCMRRLKVEE